MTRTQRFPFPVDKIDDAVRDYQNGMAIKAVAEKYGSTYATTHRTLAARTETRGTEAHDDETVRKMLAAYQDDGLTYREIAAKFGGSDVSVRNALIRRGGLTPRTTEETKALRQGQQQIDEDELVRLRNDGMAIEELARRYKVRNQRITEVLRKRGVKVRSKGAFHESFDTLAKCEALADEYRVMPSARALAERHSVTVPTVINALTRAGCDIQKPGRPLVWTTAMVDRAQFLYDSGATFDEIADELDLSYRIVRARILDIGRDVEPLPEGEPDPVGTYVMVKTTREDRQFVTPGANGYAPEHRLVAGRMLGRPLTADETAHHIDGDRANNDPSNLQVRRGQHGAGQAYECGDCGSSNVVAVPLA